MEQEKYNKLFFLLQHTDLIFEWTVNTSTSSDWGCRVFVVFFTATGSVGQESGDMITSRLCSFNVIFFLSLPVEVKHNRQNNRGKKQAD